MWPFLVALFLLSSVSSDFTDHCHDHHALGLETLIKTALALANEEGTSIREKYHAAMSHAHRVISNRPRRSVDGQDDAAPTWNPLCPTPSPRMFTTVPPPTPPPTTSGPSTTTFTSTAGPTATTAEGSTGSATGSAASSETIASVASTASNTGSTANSGTTASIASTANGGTTMKSSTSMGNTDSTTNAAPSEEESKKDPKKFKAVPLYMDHESDPLASHMNLLHKYLSAPEHACNNQFTDLNSISEHQLYGFIASLATTDVGPFCSICHRMVDEVRKRAAVVGVLVSEDEQLFGKILHSHIPSTKSICSALAPACYDNYEENVVNITTGLICAECSACMIATNILQHRVLLKPTVVAALYNFLKESLFYNICAELCNLFAGQQVVNPLWPKGFSFDACQNWFHGVYNGAIRFITTVTRPERFCSLELGWCELNEVPNMLQCLPEFCEDFLGSNPLLKLLCNLLPGDKEEAAKFLNVHHTKRYKEKKTYHDEISVGHEEL